MANWPCTNTSCKSHGIPHPNCKCPAPLAEGGEASFCSSNRMHTPQCEYYAEGGEVSQRGSLSQMDPVHAVSGHIANNGLLGMLKMHENPDLGKYDKSVNRGHKNTDDAIEKLFMGQKIPKEDRSKQRQMIEDWMEDGGIENNIRQEMYNQGSQQQFAEGGVVNKLSDGVLNKHPIEQAYPEQNIMLQAAKGRASSYLSHLMPQKNSPKLAFDGEPDNTQQKKTYKEAVRLADDPLAILREVSNGTVTHEHMNHLNAMYPEVGDTLQKKITGRIIKSQLENHTPPAHVRQGLSLLMGAPLSGEFTQQNIMAAQSVFAPAKGAQPQQPPSGSKSKKGTKNLTNADKAYLTADQARDSRQQKSS